MQFLQGLYLYIWNTFLARAIAYQLDVYTQLSVPAGQPLPPKVDPNSLGRSRFLDNSSCSSYPLKEEAEYLSTSDLLGYHCPLDELEQQLLQLSWTMLTK